MPNYEFYAQIYMQSREQQYTASYNAAYRDLMAEYKEEVRVQNLMAKMAVNDRKANAALRKALMNDPASFSEVTSFLTMKNNRVNNSEKAQAKAEGEVKKEYEYPAGIAVQTTDLIRLVDKGHFATFKTKWDNTISAEYISLTPQQQEQFAVDFVEAINNKFWDGAGRTEIMSEIFTKPPTLTREFLRTEQELRTDKARKDAALYPSKLERQQEAKALATFPELEQYDLTGDADTGVQKKSMFEGDKVKPPTEPDILALAAEYYAPSAGKEFQGSMEEIAAEREAAAQARKAEKAQLAEDVAALPEWAGRVYKVQGDTEAIIDVDDAELTSAPQEWARLHMETEKYDLPGSIAAIEKEFPDDALAQSQALAMVMRALVKRRRTKAAGDADLLELVEE